MTRIRMQFNGKYAIINLKARRFSLMDTGEVVGRNETVVDPESQENVPTCAVEIDSFHKALIMRAMVRTTALRVMLQFPGIKKSEFAAIRLTDNESDKLCQMLFKVDYDKMYTVMPAVMTLIKHAQNTPVDYREREELRMMRAEAAMEIIGVCASAATSIIASEFGVVVEPRIRSTL